MIAYNKLFIISFFACLAAISLESMHAWFLIGRGVPIFVALFISGLFFYTSSKGIFTSTTKFFLPIMALILIKLHTIDYGSLNSVLGNIFRILIFILAILHKDKIKITYIKFFTRVFACILIVSLLFWNIYLFSDVLPHFNFSFSEVGGGYECYFWFLTFDQFWHTNFPRFMGVFLEPGHLGMISSFLLFVNRFDFSKWYVWILFISIIYSLSLAAFFLVIISFVGFLFVENKISKNRVFHILIFFLFGFFMVSYTDFGKNVFHYFVLSKVQATHDGEFLDNRFSSDLKRYYTNIYGNKEFFWGIGSREYYDVFWKGGSAGYKVFIVKHGIIGIAILFVFYFSLSLHYDSKSTKILLILYIVSFLQRDYALWDVQILLFVNGLAYLDSGEKLSLVK